MTDRSTDDFRPLAPDRPQGDPDTARTDRLTEAVTAILPALDAFNRFDTPDRSSFRSEWMFGMSAYGSKSSSSRGTLSEM